MQVWEEKEVTERKRVCVRTECDLGCGRSRANAWGEWDHAPGPAGHGTKVVIEHVSTRRCYDSGESEHIELDICPECFRTKVLPALVALGVPVGRVQPKTIVF